jgi:hypothetical protein
MNKFRVFSNQDMDWSEVEMTLVTVSFARVEPLEGEEEVLEDLCETISYMYVLKRKIDY